MKIQNLRWLIVALLFIATGLSFLDRQVLSLAIIKIKDDLSYAVSSEDGKSMQLIWSDYGDDHFKYYRWNQMEIEIITEKF